jgi:hypothetical protein
METEKLPGQASTTNPLQFLYGICSYLSTGYSGATNFWDQAGGPPDYSGVPQGSYINVSNTTATYRFVVDDDFYSITVIDELGYYQHLVVSTVEEFIGCFANNTYAEAINFGNEWYERTLLLSMPSTAGGLASSGFYGNHITMDSGLAPLRGSSSSTGDGVKPMFKALNENLIGLVTADILSQSPNAQTGIPVLFPFAVFIQDWSISTLRQKDGVSGIKILNKKYINSGDTITVGGVNYVVYPANYNLPNYAIAFKIS